MTDWKSIRRRIMMLGILLTQPAFAARLDVSFPESLRFPVFKADQPVKAVFSGSRGNSDEEDRLHWRVLDLQGNTVKEGEESIGAGKSTFSERVILEGLPAGYFEIQAELARENVRLPGRGSRPEGMATFGILSPLPWLPLERGGQSRFGIQGTNFIRSGVFRQGDPYDPVYTSLGARWFNDLRNWSDAEPDQPGQFVRRLKEGATTSAEADFAPQHNMSPLYCIFNLPEWAIDWPEDYQPDPNHSPSHHLQAHSPKSDKLYAGYLNLLATHLKERRLSRFPDEHSNYYQVGWEPDWHWKGSDEEYVRLLQTVHSAIHHADSGAVVMGPGYGVLEKGVEILERLLPSGLAGALDGIAIHGYYVPFGNPNAVDLDSRYVSPEAGGIIASLRKLRKLMAQYLKKDAKLFQTEWGLDYRGSYTDVTPELLRLQAAYVIRGHLIFLGEGCDMTYFFYTADYGRLDKRGQDGYGLCFNLTMPNPSFGAVNVSPKPVFMGACTLTRVLEGTKSLGALDLGHKSVMGYAFRRGPENVVAFWSRDDIERDIEIKTGGGNLLVVDFMGNISTASPRDGTLRLKASKYPTYVVGMKDESLNFSHLLTL